MGDEPLIRWRWVRRNWSDEILPALGDHIVLCGISVLIALAISIPIGIAITRYRRAQTPVMFLTGLLYTIPSLSFFAILITFPGVKIGRTPAIIALVAYSLLVLIRNTVVGIDSVPRETIEAARGMGLTSSQILRQVELPLALPIIVAGIRIATVSAIGIATIAAYINAGGLGTLIFRGIDRDFPTQILIGAGLATLLSVLVDFGLLAVERWLRPWSRRAAARAA
ncbi:MAG: ABC transporter permease [Chloroflexota bacterium]|nr:ABC transporter permease [Chloroflexota bacterium]